MQEMLSLSGVALPVAARTAALVLDIETFLTVVAPAAELAFIHFGHIHLIRALGHLKYLVMAGRALEAFLAHMFFMAEMNRCGALG